MSGVVDLSHINDYYAQRIRCTRVHSLEYLNYMLQYKRVISVYHSTIADMVVYYIEEKDDGAASPAPLT